jgi:thiamine-phosphate pyrophosphorylase
MIEKLQYISQPQHLSTIASACEAGCTWIQLRLKYASKKEYVQMALEAKKLTDRFNAKLIVNDNLDVALEVGACGVHLGKNDEDLALARQRSSPTLIIGGSTNSLDDILLSVDKGADYLGLGPFRHTASKTDLNPILGFENMAKIMNEVQKRHIKTPIVAIGGIEVEDVPAILKLGFHGIAVSGAITHAPDKKNTVAKIKSFFS